MRWLSVLALVPVLVAVASCATTTAGAGPVPAEDPGSSTPNSPPAEASGAGETREVSGFSAIELYGIGEATVEQTGTESLTIEAESAVLPLLTSDVSGGTLRLGIKPNTSISTTSPIKYRITLKDLRGLTVQGTGSVTADQITTDTLSVKISGAGQVTIGGRTDSQELQISGTGEYHAGALSSRVATATITGSGDAEIAVSETLSATIRGTGKLAYSGDPKVTKRVAGTGKVIKK